MDSPQNHIWGPHLWIILHSAAEQIGQAKLNKLTLEETRIWSGLLASLRYSLPCPACKKHYTEFVNLNPITAIIRDSVRLWLYTLHYQVNDRTNKNNSVVFEELGEVYGKPFNFTHHLNIVKDQMGKAVSLGWSSRFDVQRSLRFFEELKRLYDLF